MQSSELESGLPDKAEQESIAFLGVCRELNRTQGILLSGGICDSGFLEIEDAKLGWEVSAKHRKSKLKMHNFKEEHPQVIENV